jgi:hypothetical protein
MLNMPQIGGTARKTNYDYNKGKLDELIDVMIDGGCKIFVCAIGIPPRCKQRPPVGFRVANFVLTGIPTAVVDKLHKNGVL